MLSPTAATALFAAITPPRSAKQTPSNDGSSRGSMPSATWCAGVSNSDCNDQPARPPLVDEASKQLPAALDAQHD